MALKRRGIVVITPERLLEALRFPKGADLYNVMMDHETEQIRILVGTHKSLPTIMEGAVVPCVTLRSDNLKTRFVVGDD